MKARVFLLSLLLSVSTSGQASSLLLAGKVAATCVSSVGTGGLMFSMLRICKWSQALEGHYSFFPFAGALLYSQGKIVKSLIGKSYRYPSQFLSIAVMASLAGWIIYREGRE